MTTKKLIYGWLHVLRSEDSPKIEKDIAASCLAQTLIDTIARLEVLEDRFEALARPTLIREFEQRGNDLLDRLEKERERNGGLP